MNRAPNYLKRDIGLFGAMMMGLGSIIGTGVFVSIGIAAAKTGPSVILAIVFAGILAVCNALSSAQLAANHPVSGGTYEYGYKYLKPWIGFSAGWLFLCAKSASAATAALGFSAYARALLGPSMAISDITLAAVTVSTLVFLVCLGARRSSNLNILIASVTILSLFYFIFAGASAALTNWKENFHPFFNALNSEHSGVLKPFLESTALMFVAYTGYGRIATLGEEVENPRRNIPRAIVLTLWVSMSLYIGVAFVGLAAVGAEALSSKDSHIAAPLAQVAQSFSHPSAFVILSIGACTSMLGVLLNLILGLSRVILAMARRGDMPRRLAEVNSGGSPTFSILAVGSIILGLVAIGSIEIAWTFSAFTVLCYYAITNAAALQLPKDKRLYHPAISIFGLSACLGLAFWVERTIWIVGLLMLFSGLLLRHMFRDTPKE